MLTRTLRKRAFNYHGAGPIAILKFLGGKASAGGFPEHVQEEAKKELRVRRKAERQGRRLGRSGRS